MRKRWFIGVFVALSLVAAACGGDDDDDGGSGQSSEEDSEAGDNGGATDVGVTADTVRVAIVSEKTGSQTATSNGVGFDDGFEAYIEMVNDDGGVHGREIDLVAELDDTGNAGRNAALVQQAFEQEQAFAVIMCTSVFGGVSYVQTNKAPVIGCNHDGPTWEKTEFAYGTNGNWFDKTPGDDPPSQENANVAYVMGKLKKSKLGVFSYQHPGSKQASENVCNWAEEFFGMECVFEDYTLPFGFTDIGASVQKLKESGADFIYGGMDSAGALTVIRSLQRAGLNIPTMWAIAANQEEAAASSAFIGDYFAVLGQPPFDSDNPAMKELVDEVTSRKPGTKFSQPVVNGWVSAKLLVEGLEAAGPNLTRDAFHKAIRGMNAFNSGLGGTVDFTKSPEEKIREGIEPDPEQCAGFLVRGDVQGKKMVQVGEKPILCLAGINTPEELEEKLDDDDSSLEVDDQ